MSVRVGILSFAHVHAPNYAAALGGLGSVEFVGVSDDDAERGREAADGYGVRFFRSAEELFGAVDAVVVCSENRRHAEGVIPALRAGVDVLCEKPISTTVEDAREMIRVSEQTGCRLGIAFPVRHAPAIRRAREVVRSGAIGRVLAVNGTNHGQAPGGWFLDPEMSGGGAVMDHTVHVADTLRFVLGVEVKSVYAEVGTFFGAESVDDAGILTLELEGGVADGAFATVDPSWSRGAGYPTWGDFTLRITGSSGVLDVDAFSRSLTTFDHEAGRTVWTPAGEDPNRLMLDDFLGGDDGRIGAGGEDGLRALEVVLAAYRSGQGHAPVGVAREA